jgi:hypothetical protein
MIIFLVFIQNFLYFILSIHAFAITMLIIVLMILLLFLKNITVEAKEFFILKEFLQSLLMIILKMKMLFKVLFIYTLSSLFQNMIIAQCTKFFLIDIGLLKSSLIPFVDTDTILI